MGAYDIMPCTSEIYLQIVFNDPLLLHSLDNEKVSVLALNVLGEGRDKERMNERKKKRMPARL